MYAHVEHVNSQPGPGTEGRESAALAAKVARQPGSLGCVDLQQLAGPAAVRLTLWDTRDNAAGFMATRAWFGTPAGELYEVAEYEQGLPRRRHQHMRGCCTSTARAHPNRSRRRTSADGSGSGPRSATSAGWSACTCCAATTSDGSS